MATGRLGTVTLSTGTNATVYTCPADTFAVVSVSFCNRSNNAQAFRLAIADASTPTTSEYVEYDAEVLPKGVLERTGLVLAAGQKIVAYASSSGASVVVYGIETSTL
jgi:hypothetical protein